MHDARLQKKERLARIKANKLPSTCLKHEIKNWFPSIGPNKLNENYNNQQKDQTYGSSDQCKSNNENWEYLSVLSSLIHETWWNFRSSNVCHLRLRRRRSWSRANKWHEPSLEEAEDGISWTNWLGHSTWLLVGTDARPKRRGDSN